MTRNQRDAKHGTGWIFPGGWAVVWAIAATIIVIAGIAVLL